MFKWLKRWWQGRKREECQTEHQKRIEQFMRKAGQKIPIAPSVPTDDVIILRARLVMEETLELLEAMGVSVSVNDVSCSPPIVMKNLQFYLEPERWISLADVAKEAADLSVVTIGTLTACGIHDVQLLKVVDDNNLDKFGPGSYCGPDGKWIKPPGHTKPDIYTLLSEQVERDGLHNSTDRSDYRS